MTNGRVLVLSAVVLLAACHGDSNPAPVVSIKPQANAPVIPAKHGPTPEELTAGMVEAVTVGKSTVPVAVKFDLSGKPQIGQPLEVVLAVMPQEIASAATLQVTGSSGLQVAANAGPIDMGSMDPNQAYRVSVTVTPSADGVQFLGLNVTLKHDEGTDTRSFSVPVIVAGNAEPVPAAKR